MEGGRREESMQCTIRTRGGFIGGKVKKVNSV